MGKVYIYHHNDHDGIVAAGILRQHLFEVEKRKLEDLKFIMIDYDMELNFDHIDFEESRDKVYFLDYSFSNKRNQEEFKKLLDRRRVDRDVKWIDHHITSIGMFSEYLIPGVRNTALCGAAWTYLYCEGLADDMLTLEDRISTVFHEGKTIPTFLKYIDDYDCWKHIYGDTTRYFHYGFNVDTPMAVSIRKLLKHDKKADFRIIDIIKTGEIIMEHNKFEDKNYHVDMYGFEFTLPEEHGGIKCFCLNRKGNSIMFGDKVNEYDAVIPFFYVNGKWKYSIFSNKPHVNCEAIAKTYGGGGHPKAAGWVGDFIFG